MFQPRNIILAAKDERGGAEYVTVVIAISFLLFLFLSGANNAYTLTRHAQMESVLRESLFEMERQGGLTPGIETFIRDSLTRRGIDNAKINIAGTNSVPPVEYGTQITLTIEYTFAARRPLLTGLFIGGAEDVPQTIRVAGSSASRFF